MALAGFDWDDGSRLKCQKHGMTPSEIESVLRAPAVTFDDKPNSAGEIRYRAIGKTDTGRDAFVIYTIRHQEGRKLIRPISVKFMHQKEVRAYGEIISTSRK